MHEYIMSVCMCVTVCRHCAVAAPSASYIQDHELSDSVQQFVICNWKDAGHKSNYNGSSLLTRSRGTIADLGLL